MRRQPVHQIDPTRLSENLGEHNSVVQREYLARSIWCTGYRRVGQEPCVGIVTCDVAIVAEELLEEGDRLLRRLRGGLRTKIFSQLKYVVTQNTSIFSQSTYFQSTQGFSVTSRIQPEDKGDSVNSHSSKLLEEGARLFRRLRRGLCTRFFSQPTNKDVQSTRVFSLLTKVFQSTQVLSVNPSIQPEHKGRFSQPTNDYYPRLLSIHPERIQPT